MKNATRGVFFLHLVFVGGEFFFGLFVMKVSYELIRTRTL